MTIYAPSTSLIGQGQIGQAAWIAALDGHVARSEAIVVVATYHTQAAKLGLNPDLALAQACVECTRFTSPRWREQRNPCGLGITGDDTPGHVFATPQEGITAHLHHLCAYAYSAASCPVDHATTPDFRHTFHDANPRLSHLQEPPPGRQWATGPNYVGKILAVANSLLLAAPQAPGATKEGTMPKYADTVAIITPGSNRPGSKLRGFHACVAHETDNEAPGAGAQMHHDWLINARPDASFHLVADASQSIQLLPVTPGEAEIGWHIGDGADEVDDEAFYTIGGEICVNSRAGFPSACRRMARSFAAVLSAYGQPCVDGVTVRQHGSYYSARNPGVHRGCPKHLKAGDWGVTWAQFVAMVQEELAVLAPVKVLTEPTPAPDPMLAPVVTERQDWGGEGRLIREIVVAKNTVTGKYYQRVKEYAATGVILGEWTEV